MNIREYLGNKGVNKNKSNMLKFNSKEYNVATSFIRNTTTEVLINLYMLYKRAEKSKKVSDAGRFPIPYYLIDGFAMYECEGRNKERIIEALEDKEKIDKILRLYTAVTKGYTKEYQKKNDIDYGKMIKRPVDYSIFESQRDILSDVLS